MKKLVSIIALLSLVFAMTACGKEEAKNTNPSVPDITAGASVQPDATNTTAQDGFSFDYKGTKIAMNAEVAPILEALGESKSYTEEASCAFTGLDKTYYYGSFYLRTYPKEGKDYVFCLWFADDSVTTAEGVYIGASEAEVKAAYGEENFNGTNAYIMTQGATKLTVILKDGVVSSIQYDALVK